MEKDNDPEIPPTVESLYENALHAYKTYLADEPLPAEFYEEFDEEPTIYNPQIWHVIDYFDELLFDTMTHKVARGIGVENQISFAMEWYGNDETGAAIDREQAVIAYSDEDHLERYHRFSKKEGEIAPENQSPYEILTERRTDNLLSILAAYVAGAAPDELFAAFPFRSENEQQELRNFYDRNRAWIEQETELFIRITLQRSLAEYGGHKPLFSQVNLDDFPFPERASEITSRREWNARLRNMVKNLVELGVIPLSPEEYFQLVQKIMLE